MTDSEWMDEVMQLWRKAGLPEYFLGNGGTNLNLCEFARMVSVRAEAEERKAACVLLMRMHDDSQESPFAHNYFAWAAHRLRQNDHRK